MVLHGRHSLAFRTNLDLGSIQLWDAPPKMSGTLCVFGVTCASLVQLILSFDTSITSEQHRDMAQLEI